MEAFVLKRFVYTVSTRLSREDKQRLDKLIQRFADPFCKSESERFRSFLKRLTSEFDYETRFDNEGYDDLPEDPQEDS